MGMLAALIGAVVGGTFILLAQGLDFRRRSIVAARLLLAEIRANATLAEKMVGTHPVEGVYPVEGPSPAFFSMRIWESRAVLMPEFLDPAMTEFLTEMYGYIESLMRSRRDDGLYPSGGWIAGRVADVANRLKGAATTLQNALDAERNLSWPTKLSRALSLTVQ